MNGEIDEIKFLGRIMKLYTASVKVVIYHYIEDGRYRLDLTGKEVSMKIAKESYMAALAGLEERRLVFTVRKGKIVHIEPDPGYDPIPRYDVEQKPLRTSNPSNKQPYKLQVTSENEEIEEILQRLKDLPYYENRRTGHNETRKVEAEELVRECTTVEELACGCCSTLEFTAKGKRKLLGFWMLFRSNLPFEGKFYTELYEGDKLRISLENDTILIERSLEDVLNSLCSTPVNVRHQQKKEVQP